VAKVVKGGKRFSFSALVVIGDGTGTVGTGLGKAKEVQSSIQKGNAQAKKNLIKFPVIQDTIPHEIECKFGSGRVWMKPAAPGTGVIAGGGVRAVLELAGIHDILSKSLGTQNPINLVKATVDGLRNLRTPEEVARLRGISISQVLGLGGGAGDGAQDAAAQDAGQQDADAAAQPSAAQEPAPQPAAGEGGGEAATAAVGEQAPAG